MTDSPWSSWGLEVLRTPDFRDGKLNRVGTYVVCFGAHWCSATRRFVPKFAAARGELAGTPAIADITDLKDPLWEAFQIRISPSILVFRDGSVQMRVDGKRYFGISRGAMARLEDALRVKK
ncbi:MAG: thioredoxin domain-containing protein [Thermoplasmata archaeon]